MSSLTIGMDSTIAIPFPNHGFGPSDAVRLMERHWQALALISIKILTMIVFG